MTDDRTASGVLAQIKNTVGDLLHLNVITVVGDVALTDDQSDFAPGSLQGVDKVFTRIGLLDGDIKTALSPVFVTDPTYADVRAFHQQNVALGSERVSANIQALGELIALVKGELEDK